MRCHRELLVVLGKRYYVMEGSEQLVVDIQYPGDGFLGRWTGEAQGRIRMMMAKQCEVGLCCQQCTEKIWQTVASHSTTL